MLAAYTRHLCAADIFIFALLCCCRAYCAFLLMLPLDALFRRFFVFRHAFDFRRHRRHADIEY